MLDVYSRKVRSWSAIDQLRTELVLDALKVAVWRKNSATGLVHHWDRDVQYTALSFGK